MYSGRLVFSQVMDYLPMRAFRKCVQRYHGNRHVQSFTCLDQFLCMAFAQLTYRESLRDIEACLRAHQDKLYHMGIRGGMSRNTLANANQRRDWRIYAEFAQAMIRIARPLYADEDLGLELDNTVYALDASTIDLCLSVFPWALFRSTKSAVKLHTLLDLRGQHSDVHSRLRREDARCERPRHYCGDGLRAGCRDQEAPEHLGRPLHNFAGFEPDAVRENAYFQAVFRSRLQFIESRKP